MPEAAAQHEFAVGVDHRSGVLSPPANFRPEPVRESRPYDPQPSGPTASVSNCAGGVCRLALSPFQL